MVVFNEAWPLQEEVGKEENLCVWMWISTPVRMWKKAGWWHLDSFCSAGLKGLVQMQLMGRTISFADQARFFWPWKGKQQTAFSSPFSVESCQPFQLFPLRNNCLVAYMLAHLLSYFFYVSKQSSRACESWWILRSSASVACDFSIIIEYVLFKGCIVSFPFF